MIRFKLLISFITPLIFAAIEVILSGSWHWLNVWIEIVMFLTAIYSVMVYCRNNFYTKKEFFYFLSSRRERGYSKKEYRLSYFIFIILIIWWIVIPLDGNRFMLLKQFSIGMNVLGGIISIMSIMIFYIGIRELMDLMKNNIFSKMMVNNLPEYRLHEVVRFPVHASIILFLLGSSLLMNSQIGFLLSIIIIVIASNLVKIEDKRRCKEFLYYDEYSKNVKYLIIPYVY
ncbi:MAG: hypothetical protein ACEPOV_02975 [Hyphomicrobiales bacterium]